MKYTAHSITAHNPVKFQIMTANTIFLTALVIILMLARPGYAEPETLPMDKRISLETELTDEKGGFGYVFQYYVPAPIEVFWRFKTDFDSDILLTSDELIGHRLVDSVGNSVITENRYASAPGLRFLWQTTAIPERYRLEFKLLNPEDCRHDYHFGSIQLSPAGSQTKVTQTAYFNFRGASLWVKYPWYGGMKSTLTNVAKWEQKMAKQHMQIYLAAVGNYSRRSQIK